MTDIMKDLIDLKLVKEDEIVDFFPRVRDRDDIKVLRSTKSGLIFLSKSDHIDIDYYSNQDGFDYWNSKELKDANLAVHADDRRRADLYEEAVLNKKWLDIGTGSGGLLNLLSHFSSQTTAVEPMVKVRKALISEGYRVFESIDEIIGQQFELITLFHVFEHISNPRSFLNQAYKLLSSEGRIIIEVPHANDFLISFLEVEEFKEFTFWSEHLILHTKESLYSFLQDAGFSNIVIKGVQRYPLSNHLHWLKKRKPGGHKKWDFLNEKPLSQAYENMLCKVNMTDTIVAWADK